MPLLPPLDVWIENKAQALGLQPHSGWKEGFSALAFGSPGHCSGGPGRLHARRRGRSAQQAFTRDVARLPGLALRSPEHGKVTDRDGAHRHARHRQSVEETRVKAHELRMAASPSCRGHWKQTAVDDAAHTSLPSSKPRGGVPVAEDKGAVSPVGAAPVLEAAQAPEEATVNRPPHLHVEDPCSEEHAGIHSALAVCQDALLAEEKAPVMVVRRKRTMGLPARALRRKTAVNELSEAPVYTSDGQAVNEASRDPSHDLIMKAEVDGQAGIASQSSVASRRKQVRWATPEAVFIAVTPVTSPREVLALCDLSEAEVLKNVLVQREVNSALDDLESIEDDADSQADVTDGDEEEEKEGEGEQCAHGGLLALGFGPVRRQSDSAEHEQHELTGFNVTWRGASRQPPRQRGLLASDARRP